MAEKIIKYIIAFVGLSVGIGLGVYLNDVVVQDTFFGINPTIFRVGLPILLGLIFALFTYFTSKLVISLGKKLALYAQKEVEKLPPQDLLIDLLGLVVGLVIAFLISGLYEIVPIPTVANALKILTFIFFGYLGVSIAQKYIKDQSKLSDWTQKTKHVSKINYSEKLISPKILDTSVIIDGRISDICKTGFVEGDLIVPEFVLGELRHIADSSDALKRNRGRRGLDVLKIMQNELSNEVVVVDDDFDDVPEVDVKLIKLAQKLGGSIVTNDFNLNKVASLQDVVILNINELSNAIKPVVIPGEEMYVQIIKEGKEYSQGVAYLDDGTMIVVEEAKDYINEHMQVVVTSVLQTSAGRMIFAKRKV